MAATVSELWIYPVKSCAGIRLDRAELVDTGFAYDRQWLIVGTADDTMITQREEPKLALLSTGLSPAGELTLKAPSMPPLSVRELVGAAIPTTVWGNACAGVDQGDEVADWLSAYIGRKCRLLKNDRSVVRLARQKTADGKDVPVTFVDSCPLLVISEESLSDLNGRLQEPISMNRFRPSIVIKGLGAFAEDSAETLRIGDVRLDTAKPCARCVITTIEQSTAELRGPEPLKTLSQYRRENDKVLFGHYFSHANLGGISIGDAVEASSA